MGRKRQREREEVLECWGAAPPAPSVPKPHAGRERVESELRSERAFLVMGRKTGCASTEAELNHKIDTGLKRTTAVPQRGWGDDFHDSVVRRAMSNC